MKIVQEESFEPITIVLETKDEAIAFWDLVIKSGGSGSRDENMAQMAIRLNDYFTNNAHL